MIALPQDRTSNARRGHFLPGLAANWRRWQAGARIFAESRLGMLGVILILIFALMALIHPLLLGTVWPRGVYHPETGYDQRVAPWPAGSSPAHPLGVDTWGRDILSMLMASTRPTFAVAISAALATAILGTAIGALSAYFRGPVDAILYNLSSALYLLPAPVIIVIVGSRFYRELDAVRFGLLYGLLVGGGSAAIVMRAHALTLMNRTYIEASRVSGAGAWFIITRHLVPHMLPLAVVHMLMAVVGAVVADGFIAFFGLRGIRLNWGTMVYNSITILRSYNPNIPWGSIIAPTLALSLFAAAFYMVARGLQEVADPRLRR
jgi:ABC-type dipeptide/oligopeptide/nickel transport system permease subunit